MRLEIIIRNYYLLAGWMSSTVIQGSYMNSSSRISGMTKFLTAEDSLCFVNLWFTILHRIWLLEILAIVSWAVERDAIWYFCLCFLRFFRFLGVWQVEGPTSPRSGTSGWTLNERLFMNWDSRDSRKPPFSWLLMLPLSVHNLLELYFILGLRGLDVVSDSSGMSQLSSPFWIV